MAKSVQIASVFTAIGFKVNKKDLDRLQKQLGNLKKQISSLRDAAKIEINTNLGGLQAARRELSGINHELSKIKNKQIRVGVQRTGDRGAGGTTGGTGGIARAQFRGAATGAAVGSQLGQFGPGVGLAGALAFGGAGIFQTTAQLEAIRNALGAAAGGAKEGAIEFKFLQDTAERLGINFLDNARSYQNFLAASNAVGFSVENSREVFTATASAARVLGLSAADTNGAMRAMTQILSKGTVQAEELRGQLGERIPGAVGLMAKAVAEMTGVTEVTVAQLGKMLEQGQIISKDVMPFFAKQLQKMADSNGALGRAMKSPLANLERMKNAFTRLQERIGKAEFVQELSELFKVLSSTMDSSTDGATGFGKILAILVDSFTGLVNILAEVPASLIVIAALFFPFTRWLAILSAIVLIIEDIMVGFQGGDSFIKDMVQNLTVMESVLLSIAGIMSLWLARSILIRNSAIATAAANKASAISASIGGGRGILGKAGLLGLAGIAGIAAGQPIAEALEGTSFNDALGETIARTLSFFGDTEAQEALSRVAEFKTGGATQVEVLVKVEAGDDLVKATADTANEPN